MKSGLPLRAYLVSLVLGVTLPLVALLGFFVYRDATSSAKRAAAAVSLVAARTANHVSRFLTDNNLGLEILERQQSLRLLDPVHCRSAMDDFLASNLHYANVVVRDRTGNLVCAARYDARVQPPDRESFEQAIRVDRFVVGKPYLGRSTGRWVVVLWQPINDDKGRVMGVITAGVDLVNFKFTHTDPDTPARTITRIVDAGGTVIASSHDPEHWVGRNARDAAIVRLMLAQNQGEARAAGIDGSERIFGFTSIPGTDWFVSSGVPVEVVFDGMRRDLLRIMLAAVVILALISVFSYRFMRAITAPMESIAMTADAVAAGDLDARTKSGGPRELTAIATQFNAMLDSQILTYRQLRESEKGLRQRALIFENATDAIMILDPQRHIIDWNPASERLFGYRKDEVLGRTTEFLYQPGDYAKYVPIINEAFARGEHWVMERVMLRKDGAERICETIRAPLLDAGGTLIGRIGLTRDITERKQAEETRARLAAIVEHSNDAIIGRGLDRTIISWNAAAERLLGYTAAEAIGRDLTGNFPPDLRQEAMENRRLAVTGVSVPYFETVRMTKDGRRIDVWHSVSPIKDSNGNVIGTAAIIRDITERKHAEEARARLAAIVENSNDAIIGHGHDRTIISWNAAAERILGYTAAEVIGRDLTGNYPPDLRQEAMEIRRLAATGVSVPYFETVRMTKDGRRIDVGLSISPIRDSNGNVIGTASIFRDITERKRTDTLLIEEKRALEMVAAGAPLSETLETVARTIETLFSGVLCSILLLDTDGVHLRHGAAPSLPEDYNRAIDGIAIGPKVGSCGSAAYRKQQVIVSDIATDPLWTDFRTLALRHGLLACWSTPIKAGDGKVLGTFALYYREPRAPGQAELDLIERLTHLTSIAIERKRGEEALRERERLMRLVTENVPAMIAYFDAELICRFANTAYCEFHRLNPQGVIGKTLREITGENTYRVILPSIDLVKEGKPTMLHRQEHTATGGIRHIEIHRVPDMSPEGAFRGYYAMLLDITERRRAEQTLQAAHARLRDLTAHIQSAIESERARIARDVHDSLGGALTGISMDLSWCIKQLKPARVKRDTLDRLRVMAGQAGDAMQEVRRIITDLRPSILDHLGLWAALDWLAQDFAERNGVPCRIKHAGTRRIDVPPDCATAVFRIVQEALTNVARHAYAAHVMIRIDNKGDELMIKVIDDGKGMPPERLAGPGSYGILGMQERAVIFGGSVKVTGVRAVGTSVELRLPLAAASVTEAG